jgi:nucleoside-diphosphate-sugar epimerase
MSVLITGASGFVGGAVCMLAESRGLAVRPAFRDGLSAARSGAQISQAALVGDIGSSTGWEHALNGIDAVIHCAAATGVGAGQVAEVESNLREVNVAGTINLATQAASMGVRRFVFVSSVKVNGESTSLGCPFKPSDSPAPSDGYAASKADAEEALLEIGRRRSMEVVVVRPPLVYGRGMKGNLLGLLRLIARGVPLPLGAVRDNRRSVIAVENLADFLLLCIAHPNVSGQVFLVSDGADLSTAALIETMAESMGIRARLWGVSPALIRNCAVLLGKRDMAKRLLGSLQVDISKAQLMLGWHPPITTREGFRFLSVEGR